MSNAASHVLDTKPEAPLTHWKQTVVHFPSDCNARLGEVVRFGISMSASTQNQRLYDISVTGLPDHDDDDMPELSEEGMAGHEPDCDCVACAIVHAFVASHPDNKTIT